MGRTIKVVMIGASGAGKTSLRGQYISGTFTPSYRATIGTDFHAKMIPVKRERSHTSVAHATPRISEDDDTTQSSATNQDEEQVSLQIWDTAGQERFSSLSTAFFRGADAVILVYDTSRPDTLHDLKRWWGTFVDKCPVPPGEEATWPVAVVGNKIDLLRGGERPQDAAVPFLKELIPVSEEEPVSEETESTGDPVRVNPPTPPAMKINGLPNGNGSLHPATELNATWSSAVTGNTIYHTPSSSFHEGTSSVISSIHTAREHPTTSSEWSTPHSRRGTITSVSSSSQTITPSLFDRGRPGETEVGDDNDEDDLPPLPPPPEKGPRLFFSSAKTAEGVQEVFAYIAARAIRRMDFLDAVEARAARTSPDMNTGSATNHDRTLNLLHFNVDMSKIHGRCCT